MTLTLEQLQDRIQRLYESDTSTPSSGDEDYDVRTGLLNDALATWSEDGTVRWKELFTSLQEEGDGDTETSADEPQYAMPENFVEITSNVSVTSDQGTIIYPFIQGNRLQSENHLNASNRHFYISGSPNGGYLLNLNPVPDTDGGVIDYNYYKSATPLVNATDVTEIPKPYFLIYLTLARLYEQDNRNDLVTFYEQKAGAVMEQMIINNDIPPADNLYTVDDFTFRTTGGGFGR